MFGENYAQRFWKYFFTIVERGDLRESTNKEKENNRARVTKMGNPPKNQNLVRNCGIQLLISAVSWFSKIKIMS